MATDAVQGAVGSTNGSSEPGGRRRITQKQKVATDYLLIKTRSKWRYVGFGVGALIAAGAGWYLWRLLGG